MVAVLGYAGMQHALQLTAARAAEVGSGYVAGAVTAMVVSWVGGTAVRRLPRITFLVLTLVGLDLAAAVGALIVFQEIPPHLFGLVILAASGGGGQLVGAALGGLAARRSLGRAS